MIPNDNVFTGFNPLNDELLGLALLDDNHLSEIIESHKQIEKLKQSSSFNLFDIISNKYYLENFHSDIIAFFLDPTRLHQYMYKGLFLFLSMINGLISIDKKKTPISISESDYTNAKVVREDPIKGGYIDILIRDDTTRHAIVIENKMNHAGDMPRQLPRYCEDLAEKGYSVDAAVYLPINRFSSPDESDWKSEDSQWKSIITVLPAYADNDTVSLVHWLNALAEKEISVDCASSLRQYARLVIKLCDQYMDKELFEKFYKYLLDGGKLEAAYSLVSMVNDLPNYLAQRIYDKYRDQCYPFTKIEITKPALVVFCQCKIGTISFKIDIPIDTHNYNVIFWADEADYNKMGVAKSLSDFLSNHGIDVFKDYTPRKDKEKQLLMQLEKKFPITTPLDQIFDPVLDQLSKANISKN